MPGFDIPDFTNTQTMIDYCLMKDGKCFVVVEGTTYQIEVKKIMGEESLLK